MTKISEINRALSLIDASLMRLEAKLSGPPLFSRRWVDQHEICKLLKVTTRTLKTYREQGLLPYSRIGGRVYFRLSDIERYLNSHVVRERRK